MLQSQSGWATFRDAITLSGAVASSSILRSVVVGGVFSVFLIYLFIYYIPPTGRNQHSMAPAFLICNGRRPLGRVENCRETTGEGGSCVMFKASLIYSRC
jgi:hypothetical protein